MASAMPTTMYHRICLPNLSPDSTILSHLVSSPTKPICQYVSSHLNTFLSKSSDRQHYMSAYTLFDTPYLPPKCRNPIQMKYKNELWTTENEHFCPKVQTDNTTSAYTLFDSPYIPPKCRNPIQTKYKS